MQRFDFYVRDRATGLFRFDSDPLADRSEREPDLALVESLGMTSAPIPLDDGSTVDGYIDPEGIWAAVPAHG